MASAQDLTQSRLRSTSRPHAGERLAADGAPSGSMCGICCVSTLLGMLLTREVADPQRTGKWLQIGLDPMSDSGSFFSRRQTRSDQADGEGPARGLQTAAAREEGDKGTGETSSMSRSSCKCTSVPPGGLDHECLRSTGAAGRGRCDAPHPPAQWQQQARQGGRA